MDWASRVTLSSIHSLHFSDGVRTSNPSYVYATTHFQHQSERPDSSSTSINVPVSVSPNVIVMIDPSPPTGGFYDNALNEANDVRTTGNCTKASPRCQSGKVYRRPQRKNHVGRTGPLLCGLPLFTFARSVPKYFNLPTRLTAVIFVLHSARHPSREHGQ